jgi:glutathione S-transferase
MGYRLYIANKRYSSWSMRPWVLLKALDIPFEEKLQIFEGGGRQAKFLVFSPTGRVPCLQHDGVTVWDSLAICEFVAESHPQVWPEDSVARAFARSAAAEMHSGFSAIRDECSMNCGLRIELGTQSEGLQRDLSRFEVLWKDGLDQFGGPWLTGSKFTAADAFFAPIAVRVQTYGIGMSEQAMSYVRRLLGHPAVDEWIQGGIRETAREPFHEGDCIRGRKVLRDLSQ